MPDQNEVSMTPESYMRAVVKAHGKEKATLLYAIASLMQRDISEVLAHHRTAEEQINKTVFGIKGS